MVEEQKVSSEPTSTVEPVSPVGVTPPGVVTPPSPQPLTTEQEARIQQLIDEATVKAVEQGKTFGRREMQGIKDKEVGEISRKLRLAEGRAKTYEDSFSGLDDETRQGIELKAAKGQVQYYQSAEQEERARQAQEAYIQRLNESLVSHLESLGVDKDDKRVDWATDAPDYLQGRSKFDASVAKILKEREKQKEVDLETKMNNKFKEMDLAWRKERGLDSVDTSLSGGGSFDGIPTDASKLGAFVEGLSQEDYEKNYAARIKEMQKQGKIK